MDRIRTPDQRLRVFVSSTLREMAPERAAARRAIEQLRLTPVMFELGARPHPPRELYLAYLAQSDVFVGLYWQSYGWVAPGEERSGLEDEFRASGELPRLIYVKEPAPQRDPGLARLLDVLRSGGLSYRHFAHPDDLEGLLADDLAILVSERFVPSKASGHRPASRSGPAPGRRRGSGLREEVDSFVGRRALVERIRRSLLDADVRLVTLTGPGGVGKTRLARRVAAVVADDFPGGVHVVELASVAGSQGVAGAIASGLGIADGAEANAVEQVVLALADATTLLVLDNFEHVVDAADVVAELLHLTSSLTVLVTSRELLRLAGEHVIDVPPLEVPDGLPDAPPPDEVESVVLFLDRLRALRGGSAPTAEDLAAIADITRRLDGLPLGIELAAARCRLFRPVDVLEQLRSRSDLSRAGRDRPDRQRTLHDTIRWSYELLPSADRDLFARLGVFVGSFGLDSVEAVATSRDGSDVLDRLAELADRSLIRTAGSRGGVLRFEMLETVRGFARSCLEQQGIRDDVARRHATHFLDLAEGFEPLYTQHAEQLILERATADQANFDAAADWFASHGRAGSAVRIAEILWRPWWARGHLREAIERLHQLRTSGIELSEAATASALLTEGLLSFALGAFERSLPLEAEARDRYGELEDPRREALALVPLGTMLASVDERTP